MSDLLKILKDPNYINANEVTKQAIFNKYASLDSNYTNANEVTKQAIRQKFGINSIQNPVQQTPQPQVKQPVVDSNVPVTVNPDLKKLSSKKTQPITIGQNEIQMGDMQVEDVEAQKKNVEQLPLTQSKIGTDFEAERKAIIDEYNYKVNKNRSAPFNPELKQEYDNKLKVLDSKMLHKSPEVKNALADINKQLTEKDSLIKKIKSKAIDDELTEASNRGWSFIPGLAKDLFDMAVVKVSGNAETDKLDKEKKAILARKNLIETTGADPLDKLNFKTKEDVIKYGQTNDISIYNLVKDAKKFKDIVTDNIQFSYEKLEKLDLLDAAKSIPKVLNNPYTHLSGLFNSVSTKGFESDKLAKNAFDNSLNKIAIQRESKFNNELKDLQAKGYSKAVIDDISEAMINSDPNDPESTLKAIKFVSDENGVHPADVKTMMDGLKNESSFNKILEWDKKNNLSGLYKDTSRKHAIGNIGNIIKENDKNFAAINKLTNATTRENFYKDKIDLENEDGSLKNNIKEVIKVAALSGDYLKDYTRSLVGNVKSMAGSNSASTINQLYATDVYDILHKDDSQSELNAWSTDKFIQIPDKNGKPMNVRLDEQNNIKEIYSTEFDIPIRNKELIQQVNKVFQENKNTYLKDAKEIWDTEGGKKLVAKNLTWDVWKGLLEELPTTVLEGALGFGSGKILKGMTRTVTRGVSEVDDARRIAQFSDNFNKYSENAITMFSAGTEIYGDVYKGYLEAGGDDKTAALVTTAALSASSLLTSSLDKKFIRLGSGSASRNLNAAVVRDMPEIVRAVTEATSNIADVSLREKVFNKEIRNAVLNRYLYRATEIMTEVAKEAGQEAIEETVIEPIVEKLSGMAMAKLYGNDAYNRQSLNDMGFLDPNTALVAGLTGGIMSFGGNLMQGNGKSSLKDVDYLRAAIEDETTFEAMLKSGLSNNSLTQEQVDGIKADFNKIKEIYKSKTGKLAIDKDLAQTMNFTNPAVVALMSQVGLEYNTLSNSDNSQDLDNLVLSNAHNTAKADKLKESLVTEGLQYDEKTDKFTGPTGESETDANTRKKIREYDLLRGQYNKVDKLLQTFTTENADVQKSFIEEFQDFGLEASDIFEFETNRKGKSSLKTYSDDVLTEAKESILTKLIKAKQLAAKEKELIGLEDGSEQKENVKKEISDLKSDIKSQEDDIKSLKKRYQKGSKEDFNNFDKAFKSTMTEVESINDTISQMMKRDNPDSKELEQLQNKLKNEVASLKAQSSKLKSKYGSKNNISEEIDNAIEAVSSVANEGLTSVIQKRDKLREFNSKKESGEATIKDLVSVSYKEDIQSVDNFEVNSKEDVENLLKDDKVLLSIASHLNLGLGTKHSTLIKKARVFLNKKLRENAKKIKEQVIEEVLPEAETSEDVVEVINTLEEVETIENESKLNSIENSFEKVEGKVTLVTLSPQSIILSAKKDVAKLHIMYTLLANTNLPLDEIGKLMMVKYNITDPEEINNMISAMEEFKKYISDNGYTAMNGVFTLSDTDKSLAPLVLMSKDGKSVKVYFFKESLDSLSKEDIELINKQITELSSTLGEDVTVYPMIAETNGYLFKPVTFKAETDNVEEEPEEATNVDLRDAFGIETEEFVEGGTESTSQSEIEAKKADDIDTIERRRSQDSKQIRKSFKSSVNEADSFEVYVTPLNGGLVTLNGNTKEEVLSKLHDFYDAELAALETTIVPEEEPTTEDTVETTEPVITEEESKNFTPDDIIDGLKYVTVTFEKVGDLYKVKFRNDRKYSLGDATIEEVKKYFLDNGLRLPQEFTEGSFILKDVEGNPVKSFLWNLPDDDPFKKRILELDTINRSLNKDALEGMENLQGKEVEIRLINDDDFNKGKSDEDLQKFGSMGVFIGDTLIALVPAKASVRSRIKIKKGKIETPYVTKIKKVKSSRSKNNYVTGESRSVKTLIDSLVNKENGYSSDNVKLVYVGQNQRSKVFKDKNKNVVNSNVLANELPLGGTYLLIKKGGEEVLIKIESPTNKAVIMSRSEKERERLLQDLDDAIKEAVKSDDNKEYKLEEVLANINSLIQDKDKYFKIRQIIRKIDIANNPEQRSSSVKQTLDNLKAMKFSETNNVNLKILYNFILNRMITISNNESDFLQVAQTDFNPLENGTFYADNALVLEIGNTNETDSDKDGEVNNEISTIAEEISDCLIDL